MQENKHWKMVWHKGRKDRGSYVLAMVCPDCGAELPYKQPFPFSFCPRCGNPRTYPAIGAMAAEIVEEE